MVPHLITVRVSVNAPMETAWEKWTHPDDILKWNNASDDWHTIKAENDLQTGGNFLYRMEAKDGSFGFDFAGVYTLIIPKEIIEYTIADGRKVSVSFATENNQCVITEIFESENTHPREIQEQGWQSILNNFKKYTENCGTKSGS